MTHTMSIETQVKERVCECLKMAEEFYGIGYVCPEIRFDVKGRCAGQVNITENGAPISFNKELFVANKDHFMEDTIPHEVAHYIVFINCAVNNRPYPRTRGGRCDHHGKLWKSIMSCLFGIDPKRCHNLDTSSVRRKMRRAIYKCGCMEHQVSMRMHNKAVKFNNYLTCTKCHDKVKFTGTIKKT